MYYLLMSHSIAREITKHAQEGYPAEVCGLLAGKGYQVESYFPIPNQAKDKHTRYEMEPTALLRALKAMDTQNLEWIGIYHSHPTSPTILSQNDIAQAVETKPVYVIISLKYSRPQLKAWRIGKTEIIPLDLILGNTLPDSSLYEPLSNQQKAAIIIASIVCVMLMLVISVTLLPPAPIITPVP